MRVGWGKGRGQKKAGMTEVMPAVEIETRLTVRSARGRRLGHRLIGAAGAGDTVGDVEFEDAVEICQREVEIGIKLEDRGRGGGVEGHGSVDFQCCLLVECFIGTAGAGHAVGDVELEDAVEICQGEVEIGIKLEDCGRGGGVEGHERGERLRVMLARRVFD